MGEYVDKKFVYSSQKMKSIFFSNLNHMNRIFFSVSGSYILHTADKPPYAQGHNISRVVSNFSLPSQPNVPFESTDALLQFSNSVVINEAFNAVEVSLAASGENVTFLDVP